MGRKVVGTPLEGYVRWADGLCDIFSTRLMCFGWRWCWCCSSSQFSSRMQEAGCRMQDSGFRVQGFGEWKWNNEASAVHSKLRWPAWLMSWPTEWRLWFCCLPIWPAPTIHY